MVHKGVTEVQEGCVNANGAGVVFGLALFSKTSSDMSPCQDDLPLSLFPSLQDTSFINRRANRTAGFSLILVLSSSCRHRISRVGCRDVLGVLSVIPNEKLCSGPDLAAQIHPRPAQLANSGGLFWGWYNRLRLTAVSVS